VLADTGRLHSEVIRQQQARQRQQGVLRYDACVLFALPERDQLNALLDARVDDMLKVRLTANLLLLTLLTVVARLAGRSSEVSSGTATCRF